MARYKTTLVCRGVPPSAGSAAATDITKEFVEHRPWHTPAHCTWDGSQLVLEAENDFDSTGLAIQDEFWDCVFAYIAKPFSGEIEIISVEIVE